jgi:membrane-associated phospholipid phosphatase
MQHASAIPKPKTTKAASRPRNLFSPLLTKATACLMATALVSGCATAHKPTAPDTSGPHYGADGPSPAGLDAPASAGCNPDLLGFDPRPESDLGTALWGPANTRTLFSQDLVEAAPSNPSPPNQNPFSKDYFKLLATNVRDTFTAPAHWDTSDWLLFGGVAAGVGTAFAFDQDIQRAVQRNRNATVDSVFNAVTPFGAEYAIGTLGAFYLGGAIFDDSRAKAVALDGASASLIASGLILYPTKYTVGRSRPSDNVGPYHCQPFSGHDSFPSGHTTEAFAVATVIAEHYDSLWIKLTSYGLASMVGYARLNSNVHWASDVLAGAAIGTFVGHVVVHVNEKHWQLSVQPLLGLTMRGAQLSLSF